MKRAIFLTILTLTVGLLSPTLSFAQDMIGESNQTIEGDERHTAREEAEGKEVWNKLQNKEVRCEDLSDDNFGSLGEHFMGQMMDDSHEEMNNMMEQRMGKEGEDQMHIAMGKRMSGCDSNAPLPQNVSSGGMMSMIMTMMMGGGDNSMMGNFGTNPMGWFGFGWIFMILFWILVIVGIITSVKWLANQSKSEAKDKSALDILKKRYAKGEIDKKEFEEKKKDLI